MQDRALVTGISGFLGGHVALALLNAGYLVRGSVRSLNRAGKVRETLSRAGGDIGRLEIVPLDLSDDTGWDAAARDCRYVQHVASPFSIRMPADRMEMIRPAVDGTRRALEAALAAGVQRVVMTSSAAALVYGHPLDRTAPFTEADWSRTEGPGVNAYSESKTRAELEAWSIMETAGRRNDLAVVNPTVILGPLLDDDPGVSAIAISRLLDGSVPAAPRIHLGIVDVRDVTALQLAAMTSPEAGGRRHLANAQHLSFIELAQALRAAFPAFARRVPWFELPDWIVRLYALFDADLRGNVDSLGVIRTLDCRQAETLLGRPFIAARVAALATAKSLIDLGIVK